MRWSRNSRPRSVCRCRLAAKRSASGRPPRTGGGLCHSRFTPSHERACSVHRADRSSAAWPGCVSTDRRAAAAIVALVSAMACIASVLAAAPLGVSLSRARPAQRFSASSRSPCGTPDSAERSSRWFSGRTLRCRSMLTARSSSRCALDSGTTEAGRCEAPTARAVWATVVRTWSRTCARSGTDSPSLRSATALKHSPIRVRSASGGADALRSAGLVPCRSCCMRSASSRPVAVSTRSAPSAS